MRENVGNTIEQRYRQKATQTAKTDDTQLPAYIAVVEFAIDIKKTVEL